MIIQLGVVLLTLFLFTMWGLPVASLIRPAMPKMTIATPAFGVGLLAVAVICAYRLGLQMSTIATGAVVASLIFAGRFRLLIRDGFRAARPAPLCCGLVSLFVVVICSPILRNQVNFVVFQGNIEDHFTYTTAASVYADMNIDNFRAAMRGNPLKNPLLTVDNLGASIFSDRPAISLIFALTGSLLKRAIPIGGFALLCSLTITGLLAFWGILLEFFGKDSPKSRVLALLFAGAYACGFWGQYPVTINAWSQTAAIPVLLAVWALVFNRLSVASPAEGTSAANGNRIPVSPLALSLLVASAIVIYPEGTVFHTLMLAGVLAVAALHQFYRVLVIGFALTLGTALSFLISPETFNFMTAQFHSGVTTPVDWWHYYDSYLFGLDLVHNQSIQQAWNIAVSKPISGRVIGPNNISDGILFINGVLGAYAVDPEHFRGMNAVDVAKYIYIIVLSVGVVIGVAFGLLTRNRSYRLIALAAAVGLVGATLILQLGQVWSAGKALSFTSPLLCLAITAPAMIAGDRLRIGHIGPAAWFVGQAYFVVMAVIGLGNIDGVRLPPPYPDTYEAGLKQGIEWDISHQLKASKHCQSVRIVAPNSFFRQFVSISLFRMHKHYVYDEPVISYFGGGSEIGRMPAETVPTECEIRQNPPTR